MAIVTFILGESGTGKSASLRNLKAPDVALIQVVNKPLPFKSKDWKGYVCDNSEKIIAATAKTERDVIIIDDFQYIMSNEFMRRVLDNESGNSAYQKYNEIAHSVWNLIQSLSSLPKQKRVYLLAHTDTDDAGNVRAKTIGKLLNEKINIEGMVTIVMRSMRINGRYIFSTQNSGSDTVKTPLGMFESEHIDNDLAQVDRAICGYFEIGEMTDVSA